MASNMQHELPYLPADLVWVKFIPSLPTKSAIRVSSLSKQCWNHGFFASKHVLDFDEHEHEHDDIDCLDQHKKFINFLEGYLKFCIEKEDEQVVLNSLRLHMTYELADDDNIIKMWLERAIQRGVKELDIRLGICTDEPQLDLVSMYRLPWVPILAKAKYLTSLSLGHMVNLGVPNPRDKSCLLPSLKTLSFKNVYFVKNALPSLLPCFPYMEHLSFTSCDFLDTELHIHSCPSLKFLEFKYCLWLDVLKVDKVENLQSFKFVSLPPPRSKTCVELHLNVSSNMKNIYIHCVDGLHKLLIRGCHGLEATIITQSLKDLSFQGYLSAKLSIQACPKANISLDADQFCLPDDSPHFPSIMKFLRNFECCEDIFLKVPCDFKALVVPEAYRNILPAPLPKCSFLVVKMPNPPTKGSGDYFDLMDSLHWIAPSSAWVGIYAAQLF